MKALNTAQATWPTWPWLNRSQKRTPNNHLLRRIICHLSHGSSHTLHQIGYGGIYQVVCSNCDCSWLRQR